MLILLCFLCVFDSSAARTQVMRRATPTQFDTAVAQLATTISRVGAKWITRDVLKAAYDSIRDSYAKGEAVLYPGLTAAQNAEVTAVMDDINKLQRDSASACAGFIAKHTF